MNSPSLVNVNCQGIMIDQVVLIKPESQAPDFTSETITISFKFYWTMIPFTDRFIT